MIDILITEDNKELSTLMSDFLRAEGYTVTVADSGEKALTIFEKYGVMPAVYAGGVMSDTIIKNSFEEKYNAVFAEPSFSTDNAAGIAYLCYRKSLCTLQK